MKKIIYYTFFMIAIIIILPLFIVRGCSSPPDASIQQDITQPARVRKDSINIKVYITTEKRTIDMPLEDYIKGVIAAEMPAEFSLEALKAQAVAARTYALGRMNIGTINAVYKPRDGMHDDADVCTDPKHCQAWTSRESAMKNWGIFAGFKYWNKIIRAVDETEGIVLTYNNKIINPVFHSNSGGRTENSEEVWSGTAEPYLKSVISPGEESSKEFKNVILLGTKEFYDKIKLKHLDIKLSRTNILESTKILDLTEGGRVRNIKIGNIVLKGTEFREIFALKSANFKIEKETADTLRITSYGYGHGVGMSQWGANYMAKNGKSYDKILKYYYTGVTLCGIDSFVK